MVLVGGLALASHYSNYSSHCHFFRMGVIERWKCKGGAYLQEIILKLYALFSLTCYEAEPSHETVCSYTGGWA